MLAEPFILFDDSLAGRAKLFARPQRLHVAWRAEQVAPCLAAMEADRAAGLTLAGYAAYELGYALEPKLAALMPSALTAPLLCFGAFEEAAPEADAIALLDEAKASAAETNGPGRPAWSLEDYRTRFHRALDYIFAGDIYQVNLTFPIALEIGASPLGAYGKIRRRQPVTYGALARLAGPTLLSFSPELFFEVSDQGLIEARPMKGTIHRGAAPEEDARLATSLAADVKNRAENLMIVDLLRNDLSRISKIGSVKVPALFQVESYRTLHQMVSRVQGQLTRRLDLAALFTALFPCGSITGAPKIRAMEIIRELEAGPRGVYCGAIGWVAPDRPDQPAEGPAMRFNVAIRTISLDQEGQALLQVGSGLVADSEVEAEVPGMSLESALRDELRLIETLLWTKDQGFWLLQGHLARLARSAGELGFAYEETRITAAMEEAVANSNASRLRVRLLLAAVGDLEVTASPLSEPSGGEVWRLAIAEERLDPSDFFLLHKTTRRLHYDRARAQLCKPVVPEGPDEVIFLNTRGEVCDGSITTLFADFGTGLVTPPLSCGLLPGVLRAHMLETGKAREAVVRRADLARAERLFVGNSVRGLISARAPSP